MTRNRSFLDRKVDGGLALMLGLLTISHVDDLEHRNMLVMGYMMTLTQRAAQGAKLGDG